MSLITLRSSQHQNGATLSESAALISNFFKEGIPLHPGNSLELVSMSITKLEKFEIIEGQNDTFIWRIGNGPSALGAVPNFSQHIVKLPAGNYNGADLALTLKDSLNNSTLLGNYRGEWAVTFSAAVPAVPGGAAGTNAKFSVVYGQKAVPASNGEKQVFNVLGAGNNPAITKEPNHIKIQYATATGFENWKNISNGFYGDKSIFPNGGEAEWHIAPVQDLDSVDLAGQPNTWENWETETTGPEDVLCTITEPGGLANDWIYKIDISDGEDGLISTITLPGNHGAMGTATLDSGGTGYLQDDTGTFTTNGKGTGATWKATAVDGTGAITTLDITAGGDNYTDTDTLVLVGGNGADGTANVATIVGNDGTNYNAGDSGTLSGGSGTGATYTIPAGGVDNFGAILAINITDPGSDYASGDSLSVDGGSGTGAKVLVQSVVRGANEYYGVLVTDGYLGVADSTGSDATDPSNWNVGRMKYNVNTNTFQGTATAFPAAADYLENSELKKGGDGTAGSGGPFTPTLANFCYPQGRFGRSRDQLITGITDYPGNAEARINSNANGQDVSIHLSNNADFSDIQVEINGFVKSGGVQYPQNNWRTLKNFTDVVESSNWISLAQQPANWATFNYATDHIRIRCEQYGVRNNRFHISHDAGGNQVWAEEVTLLQTADDNDGIVFTSTIREVLYPYCPTFFVSRGGRFSPASYKVFGIYDDVRIANVPGLVGSTKANGTQHSVHDESEAGLADYEGHSPLQAPAANLTLGYIAKAGIIDAADVHDGPDSGTGANEISNRSLQPNTANINFILGFETAYTFQSGSETNTIATADIQQPQTSIQEPSLHVELPDFNIKSYSGESGDTGRAVAVIPKEQWTTDSKTGTLQYVAPYPIPIDLNIAHSQVINEIKARLRQPSGEIANDLINPTEICLRLTESDETKQQRIMNNALQQLNSFNSNMQDIKISNFNNNMPKL
tara:strand:+ start:16095 stop:18986 length:2892 start_codon:yes stop_codon:yes gene_type:complete